jgi:hypothetical protein
MNRFLQVLMLLCIGQSLSGQYVYTIKADSVKITNSCDTAELILENHTQAVPGFLYNKGRGRTEFRRGAVALNDSLYLIGGDTLNLYKGRVNVTASNGLTATKGNIKMGGNLTDVQTVLTLTPNDTADDQYDKQFIIQAPDRINMFRFLSNYAGKSAGYGFQLDATCYDKISGSVTSFAVNNRRAGFSLSKGAAETDFYVDQTGAYFTGNIAAGKSNFVPTAHLHLDSGTVKPGTAPLKFTPGSLLTTSEVGAVEYDGTYLYLTDKNSSRYILAKTLQGQVTTNFGGPSLTAFNSVTTTLTVAGAQPGDVVNVSANTGAVNPPSIIITAYVTSADRVTLQAYNASSSAISIASDTYNVRVIK